MTILFAEPNSAKCFLAETTLALVSILVMHMENPYILVMVTASSKQEAEKIAQQLLEEKLIACVNVVGPVASHFNWAGKIDHVEEYLMLMKSRVDLFEALVAKVNALHSYEVPEVIALPVLKGSAAYLDWLGSVLK